MGFSITLQAVSRGELGEFGREIAQEHFQPHAESSFRAYPLSYDGEYGGMLGIDDTETINGVGLERPSDAAIMSLYEVARRTPSFMTWCDSWVVADAAFVAEIPDMILSPSPSRQPSFTAARN